MLRISSFNIQNDFSKYNINKSKEIYNYLVQNKINILGLQEVYSKINKDLIKLLLLGRLNFCSVTASSGTLEITLAFFSKSGLSVFS